MDKKGQVALWFIAGLVILIFVILGVYYRENILDFLHEQQIVSGKTIPAEVEPVNQFILDCVHQIGEEAIAFVSFYGGYYNTSNAVVNERGIPYYLINKKLRVPSKVFLQNSLSAYMNNNLKTCTEAFTDFNNSFDISEENVGSRVKIDSGKVNFFVKYPVSLKKGETEHVLKYFNVDVDSNMDKVYTVVVKAVNEQLNYSDICVTCLYDLATENNLTVDVYNPTFGELEYTFTDDQFKILNESYNYVVALRLE